SSAPRLPLTREKILAAHAQLARGPGGTVELAALREALPGSREDELETILVQLDREGIVRLTPAVDLALLDERLKSAAIDDPLRGPLVYVSRSQTSHAETTP
ncbi:MAG TPA: hypothetical protein VFF73_35075, partial [Planctomycetota bacterium]|nr:hypothetical protein [Planctomycetota bacterium]